MIAEFDIARPMVGRRPAYKPQRMNVVVKTVTYKLCCICHRMLPVDDFCFDRSRRDGLDVRCRPCAADNKRLHR